MRSPKQQTSERRVEAGRPASAGSVKASARQGAADQKGGVVTSMVDALEDILKWERASERALRVAAESKTDLDASTTN